MWLLSFIHFLVWALKNQQIDVVFFLFLFQMKSVDSNILVNVGYRRNMSVISPEDKNKTLEPKKI